MEEDEAPPPPAAAAAANAGGMGGGGGFKGSRSGAEGGGGQGEEGRRDELPLIVQGLLSLRSPSVNPGGAAESRASSRSGSAASSIVGGAGEGWAETAGTHGRPPMMMMMKRAAPGGGVAILKGDSGGSTTSAASSDAEAARVKPLSPPEGAQAPITVRSRGEAKSIGEIRIDSRVDRLSTSMHPPHHPHTIARRGQILLAAAPGAADAAHVRLAARAHRSPAPTARLPTAALRLAGPRGLASPRAPVVGTGPILHRRGLWRRWASGLCVAASAHPVS